MNVKNRLKRERAFITEWLIKLFNVPPLLADKLANAHQLGGELVNDIRLLAQKFYAEQAKK